MHEVVKWFKKNTTGGSHAEKFERNVEKMQSTSIHQSLFQVNSKPTNLFFSIPINDIDCYNLKEIK
jgi:hypothetical protein